MLPLLFYEPGTKSTRRPVASTADNFFSFVLLFRVAAHGYLRKIAIAKSRTFALSRLTNLCRLRSLLLNLPSAIFLLLWAMFYKAYVHLSANTGRCMTEWTRYLQFCAQCTAKSSSLPFHTHSMDTPHIMGRTWGSALHGRL